MFHEKNEQTPKPRLCTFTAVLLLQTLTCTDQYQVKCPPQPIVAFPGANVIFSCHLVPAIDATSTAVEWTRPDLKPRFVHLWRSGQEILDDQHPSYKGRTSLSISELKHGDISLNLSKVKPSDEGIYRCYIPMLNIDSDVELVFGSVSSPEIDMSKISDGVLDCKSEGKYLKPEVFWLDGEGNLLPAGPTETVRGPDDLYTVSRRLTVEKSDKFTCRVQQKNITQTREAHVRVPVKLFEVSSSAVRISIFTSVCFMFIVAAVFVMWRVRQVEKINNRHMTGCEKTPNENEPLMEEGRHVTGSEKKMKHLDKRKAKPDEDLQKKEEELKHVEHMITTLTELKKNLKNQREKFSSLLQEDKVQIEVIKKKLKDGYKVDRERKALKAEKIKDDLEKRQKEHNELLQNTENLQETTEELIIKMREKKATIKNDKEQMNKT